MFDCHITIMLKVLAVLLVVFLACVGSGELHTAVDESGCPPWTYRPNSTSPCQCGSSVDGIVHCNITTGVLSLQMCLCMTYDNRTNESIAGLSPYSCIAYLGEQVYQLPTTRNNFNKLTCGIWKSVCVYHYCTLSSGQLFRSNTSLLITQETDQLLSHVK